MTGARSKSRRNRPALVIDPVTPMAAPPVEITASDIARRAFELYLARGRQDGFDLDDWLRAEQELLGARDHIVR